MQACSFCCPLWSAYAAAKHAYTCSIWENEQEAPRISSGSVCMSRVKAPVWDQKASTLGC